MPGGPEPWRSPAALVVEADRTTRSDLSALLMGEGFRVHEAASAAEACDLLERRHRDLDVIVLDPSLPDADGLALLEHLRRVSAAPVLVVLDREGPRGVRALDLGADDYVAKPWRAEEIAARVRALSRRWHRAPPIDEVGPLVVDRAARRARLHGTDLQLTPRELALLAHLVAHPGVVHSREELLREVWGSSPRRQGTSTVTEHVRRLRVKIQALDPAGAGWFTSVRGLGYRFDPPK